MRVWEGSTSISLEERESLGKIESREHKAKMEKKAKMEDEA